MTQSPRLSRKPAALVLSPSPEAQRLRLLALGFVLVLLALFAAMSQASARGAPESFADLAERLSPAVVNISTTQTLSQDGPEGFDVPQLPPGFPFEDRFREFFERGPGGEPSPRKVNSLGSGFIIDADGIVVTNNHVIADADEITVILTDGSRYPAELVGRDAKTDLAVLRIEPKQKLPSLTWGDSRESRVGDWVLAIGNPFGLGGTVTAGIISAMNRDIASGPYDDYIQTDASINRGNSGGPLFNLDGEIIGVNTAIISPSGGSIGIGFSIPSELVTSVVDQLIQFGETRRGWLGVRIQSVTDEIAEGLGLDRARGALVAEVTPDSPAAEAGLEPGDLILQFDGRPVPDMRDLPRMVAETEIGKKVKLQVLRKGETKSVDVTIARLDESGEVASTDQPPTEMPTGSEVPSLGLTLSEMTPSLRKQYAIADNVEGVLVVGVDGKSPAAGTLRAGDVIVEVAQSKVSTPSDVREKLKSLTGAQKKSNVVLFLVNRGGDLTFLTVRPSNS